MLLWFRTRDISFYYAVLTNVFYNSPLTLFGMLLSCWILLGWGALACLCEPLAPRVTGAGKKTIPGGELCVPCLAGGHCRAEAFEIHLSPLSTTKTEIKIKNNKKKVSFVTWVCLSETLALLMTTNEKSCSEDQNPIFGFQEGFILREKKQKFRT